MEKEEKNDSLSGTHKNSDTSVYRHTGDKNLSENSCACQSVTHGRCMRLGRRRLHPLEDSQKSLPTSPPESTIEGERRGKKRKETSGLPKLKHGAVISKKSDSLDCVLL